MTDVRVSIDASAVPANPAGAGRYVIDLVAALHRQPDLRLTVICRQGDEGRWRFGAGPQRPGAETGPQRPGAEISAASVIGAAPARRPQRLAWEQARLPGLLGRLPIDVHHSPHYTMPERASIPRVVTIHDLSFIENPGWHEPFKVAFFRHAIRAAAARADALIAVSAATAARLDALVSPKAPVHVIPHGVDTALFHPPDVGDPGDRGDPGQAGPYVLFLGTIEPRKDVPTLVRAFDRLAADHPDLTLVLAGAPGWGTDAVDAAIANASHADRVRRLGYVSEHDKASLLQNAAVVAYPSLEEGFGLPALEALACGAPLVTTTGSAMEEIVGPAALLVAPGDTKALAEAIEAQLAGGPGAADRRQLGLDIASRYTWEASAAAHVAVYRSVR